MRVSDGMRVSMVTWLRGRTAERMDRLTREAASGERVGAPSDDPAAYAFRVRGEARLDLLEARKNAASLAADDLRIAEGTLASATELLARARELAVQMSNGSVDAATRAATARQVRDLRAAMIGLANERGARGYLFGGEKTDGPPFDASGSFLGNDRVLYVETSDGSLAEANASGARAFTAAGGQDVFATLESLALALEGNSVAQIQASIGALEGAHRQVVVSRVATGMAAERLGLAVTAIEDGRAAARQALASATEADVTSTYSDLVGVQGSYERSLEVLKRALSLASLDRFR